MLGPWREASNFDGARKPFDRGEQKTILTETGAQSLETNGEVGGEGDGQP